MQQKNNSSILWKSETSFRKLRKFRYIIELFDAKCDIIWVIVNYVLNWKSRHRNRAKNEEGRAFKCTSFYLKQSCQAMQVVMQYYISRCNKAKKKKGTKNKSSFKPGGFDDFHGWKAGIAWQAGNPLHHPSQELQWDVRVGPPWDWGIKLSLAKLSA